MDPGHQFENRVDPRDHPPASAEDGGVPAFMRGPASFANVIPMPGTSPTLVRHDHQLADSALLAVGNMKPD